jgi:hypothetical protein
MEAMRRTLAEEGADEAAGAVGGGEVIGTGRALRLLRGAEAWAAALRAALGAQ